MQNFTSKALLANLEKTFVKEVRYSPSYFVIIDAFSQYPALKEQITNLLRETFHPYKNPPLVLEDLRNFFSQNLFIVLEHSKKTDEAFWLIFDLFFKFFGNNHVLNIKCAEAIFSILEKTISFLEKTSVFKIKKAFKEVLKAIYTLPEKYFLCFLESYYSFKKLLKRFPQEFLDEELTKIFEGLLKRSFILTYSVWGKLTQGELEEFLTSLKDLELKKHFHSSYFYTLIKRLKTTKVTLEELFEYPDHLDLLRDIKNLIYQISCVEDKHFSEELKLVILFKFIRTPLLKLIHEELIKEVNQLLLVLIEKKSLSNLDEFLIKFFRILKEKLHFYPWTALECIKHIGKSILNKKDTYLAEVFINEVIKFGFQAPEIKGIDSNWRLKQNPHHVLNIKIWLEIFKINPEWCSSLLSALILNLKLYGVSIKDTDLFQKEITKLLNANIKPVYNLVKQFCKVLPVYYNEIGAEGKIRDISTEIDELFSRKDSLIHFLRKFIHIENSNVAVDFIKDIFRFWYTLDGSYIKTYIPKILYERITKEELSYHKSISTILRAIFPSLKDLEEAFSKDISWIKERLFHIKGKEKETQKIYFLFYLYKLEYEKYYQSLENIEDFVSHYTALGFEWIKEIKTIVEDKNISSYEKASKILDFLKKLKEEIILSDKKFEPIEEILVKRHIAVDIPSMYGRYREKKFDALGLSFRLEKLAERYIEEVVNNFQEKFIIRSTLFKILKILKLFEKVLQVDGIFSQKFFYYLRLFESALTTKSLTYSQYRDILKGLIEGVQHILKVYYINPYLKVFPLVYNSLDKKKVVKKYQVFLKNRKKDYFSLSEAVIKELVASAFCLSCLDNFLKKVYQVFIDFGEKVSSKDLYMLLNYDKRKICSFIHDPNPFTLDLLYLGNKAYNLITFAQEKKLNINIPPGFILTTEIFKYYDLIKKYKELWEDYKNSIKENISKLEEITKKKFGEKKNPLILSIRSGSAISMPGMMSSILNVGINEEIVEGLYEITGNLWFAWDTYRRFIQSWAMAYGIKRDFFNKLMREHKRKYGVKKKKEFTGEQMKELALKYKEAIKKLGIPLLEDPWDQLFKAIELILMSWNNEKAKAYRKVMEISEDWGTAVIVQKMVFGNLGSNSGTGVAFTTSPVGKFPRILLWGDYTPFNQGEDIVSGLVTSFPISKEQKKIEGRDGPSLEEAFPEIYKFLLDFAYYLVYEKKWGHQEIEFTFEDSKVESLYILQVRDLILREDREVSFFSKDIFKSLHYIGKGIGVSGGIVSGRVVFDLEDIKRFKKQGEKVILLRYDTVPDNIQEISLVDGILTARGGQTSHAAIVASRLGKVCVVGCEHLSIDEFNKKAKLNEIPIALGEWLTLNGSNGNIYKGKINIKEVRYETWN